MNLVRSMIFGSDLALHFWRDAAETTRFLQAAQEDPEAKSSVDTKSTVDTKSDVRPMSGARMIPVDIRKNTIGKMVTRNQGMKTPAREIVSMMIEPDPKTYNQAMKSEKHVEWMEAVDAQLASQAVNQSWTIVPRTDEIKALYTQ
uniref:AlNc14C444G11692 protein n=1 Tax=Albugo laibachii Nc14 TaxID=890382 RepID=F0WZV1_9STRA|nr:AlNc14C444G11692 [Albugo laibachii Nc14]|eukprot:CCA27028.1 AlNc14C444G11692 [Albugo laibachii Nc14]